MALFGVMGALLAGGAAAFYQWGLLPQRHEAEDRSVKLWQIRAAAGQFFLENPERVFAAYEDLVGPGRMITVLVAADGEDYRHLFPLRVDFGALSVTMGDGRQVIVMPDGALLQVAPDGRWRGAAAAIERFQTETAPRPDGIRVVTLPGGARLETAYRGGRPDGPFRAFYGNGKLWANATYANGRPSGRHEVYDQEGKVIHQTVFVP